VELLTSVCTGALLLGEAHLLDGLRATTHWAALDLMRKRFPQVKIESQYHWVEDGNVMTSAGISAGIDMALRIVARYFGETVARNAAQRMEYPYPESNARRVSVCA
jgi:transcriptional regulator GlxA family with amidase domain